MTSQLNRLAYAALNLRFNPFGELSREQRVLLAVVDIGDLPQRLCQPRVAIQFLADHGYGKSTHLLALHAQFSQYTYTQVHTNVKPHFTAQEIQFVDSIENLSRLQRARLYRLSPRIAFTTHRDLSQELTTAGYSVYTRTLNQQSVDRVQAIFNRRIAHARRFHDEPVPTVTAATVSRLIERFDGNIRAMEYELYEMFQDLKAVADV